MGYWGEDGWVCQSENGDCLCTARAEVSGLNSNVASFQIDKAAYEATKTSFELQISVNEDNREATLTSLAEQLAAGSITYPEYSQAVMVANMTCSSANYSCLIAINNCDQSIYFVSCQINILNLKISILQEHIEENIGSPWHTCPVCATEE